MFEWPVPVSWRSQQENRDTGLDKTSGHGCSDSKSQSHICCSWRVYGRRKGQEWSCVKTSMTEGERGWVWSCREKPVSDAKFWKMPKKRDWKGRAAQDRAGHKACVDRAVRATVCSPEAKLTFQEGAIKTKYIRAGQSLLFPRLKMLLLLWQWQGYVAKFVLPWKSEAHHCLSNNHSALTHLSTILHSLFEKVSISAP